MAEKLSSRRDRHIYRVPAHKRCVTAELLHDGGDHFAAHSVILVIVIHHQ
jgi:hypothetical protein